MGGFEDTDLMCPVTAVVWHTEKPCIEKKTKQLKTMFLGVRDSVKGTRRVFGM